jgi:hypothetical protein
MRGHHKSANGVAEWSTFSAAASAETRPEFFADADYRGLCRRTPPVYRGLANKMRAMIDRADRQAGESAMEDTLSSKHH